MAEVRRSDPIGRDNGEGECMTVDDVQLTPPAGLSFSSGDVFPDLELPAVSDGAPRLISEWRGQHVMLHLFASW